MRLHGGPGWHDFCKPQGDGNRRCDDALPVQVSPRRGRASVPSTLIFSSFFFAVGLLAIPWLLPAEYAPLPIRASAAALASASNWIVRPALYQATLGPHTTLQYSYSPGRAPSPADSRQFTFLVVEITPVSIKSIGYRTYIYFCVFNACFVPMIYFLYPETARLSLENIDLLFTGDKVLLKLPKVGLDLSARFGMLRHVVRSPRSVPLHRRSRPDGP